ncbi:MAG TPA: PqqD family protein [Anaerolineae bacterium]|nr:PqqD family protein [Anaerolineae bacterium]
MLNLDSRPKPNASVQGRQLENEAVLVLPDKGEVKVLNEVGAQIWQLADGRRTVREIAAAICADYAVSCPEVETDTLEFVAELVAKGIISIQA